MWMVELRNNYPVEVFDDKTAARNLPQTDNKINKEILEAYQNGTEPKPFGGYY
ncbi:hypothetical protein N7280_00795 [Rickettsia rhipicephali]|uniref:hypothetical protein n=1 Tax=Rickettsia rhipicephali TaxID=33992 RepID=UPI00225BE8A8|nr:hypothetical protein [Rickettsia rhipicephali]MCX4079204.1 hypothetical protein [Rickettsia rhipicephali]